MQFYDEVKITIESGKGGNGLASGRREAGAPFGGPSGGDGGKGGAIIIKANKDENTLLEYKYKKVFKAKNGEDGRTKDQYGADAEDFMITVPVETLIKDAETGRILHHFTKDQEERIALPGGEGGKGNIHFKDAVNQYPNFYLLGEPGQKAEIILELQLLGDVGLIGNPSVGKSSLINCAAATKAKVAEYHFTTLVPNLGSVSVGDFRYNMVDIPGLIKGAADGKGLGNDFLRHVLKSRIFAMVMDMARFDEGIQETIDLFDEITYYVEDKFLSEAEDYNFEFEVDGDLISFSVYVAGELFMSKRVVFVLNKYDLINDEELVEEYQKQLVGRLSIYLEENGFSLIPEHIIRKNIFVTSAGTYFGVGEWIRALAEILKKTPVLALPEIESTEVFEAADEEEMISDITEGEKQVLVKNDYLDEVSSKYTNVYLIQNPEVCRLVFIIPRGNEEAELRFWKQMQQRGFIELFEQFGIRKGDVLKVRSYYEGHEDRYIVF
ncbi:MAG: Obg family GTPase CgtA [Candidatus Absconditabacteria bacterium]|nr:Obg family GTPase CgtA [Candidatus Absconditabacteria bacterium]MDD3867983.1 Obg family GTPase CgtA [Candidatus Absconditabacteria bacterium]MDD4714230.1 Obg family GTPase CgtA [Candidatus Absconditabacteria bacterium]